MGTLDGLDFLPFTALRVFIFLDFSLNYMQCFHEKKKDKVKNQNVQ